MIPLLFRFLPVGTLVGLVVLGGALQLAGIDVLGMATNAVRDLVGIPDWTGLFDVGSLW
ncbi:hypothetical protein KU306_01440 [Haloferax larsenii]|uniref:Uncharacterized protein n=1 Tax=Haloferax larsenii TaxID=302484 RepID=A0ABY5RE22_HALLR|nr:hypothetical protein [Haloferax larsenii]UVE50596.1 hypothetical protein KU306_01440 [Haloferax larsenii]